MNPTVLTFLLYLLAAGNTTYFLGRSLYRNGEQFLLSIFSSRRAIVAPLNKVLLAGFYAVNTGLVLLSFRQRQPLTDLLSSLEFLAEKLGTVYLVLGIMHLFNLFVFIVIEHQFNAKPL